MLYLAPGQEITPLAIAQRFDNRASVESGYLDSQFVFKVSVYGSHIGYIVPPINGGAWGINLMQGSHELRGYYIPVVRETDEPFGVLCTEDMSGITKEFLIDNSLAFDLVFFAPLS